MKKTTWIARTGICLALLVCVQLLTRSLGQVVTGSCVNLLLAAASLIGGAWSGAAVGLLSPLFAKLLGIGPVWPLVPCVALGNVVYALVIGLLTGRLLQRQRFPAAFGSVLLAAGLKFVVLWLVLVKLVAPLVISAAEALAKLAVMFGAVQLLTAAIGGAVAFAIVPTVQRALKKEA